MPDSSTQAIETTRKGLSNNGFTLKPAIFVSVEGFNLSEALPKDRDEKLKRILENLHKHHNAVRRNMIGLVALQKEKLLADTRELLKIEERNKQTFSAAADSGGLSDDHQQEVDEVMRNLRRPKHVGSRGSEYEYRERDLKVNPEALEGATDSGGDITMGGMGATEAKTTTTVQQELNRALQELALRAASEMEAYDKHAESTKNYYRRALQRNAARMGSDKDTTVTTEDNSAAATDTVATRGRGILSNKNESANIDMEARVRATLEQRNQTSTLPNNAADASRDPRRRSVDATEDMTMGHSETVRGFGDASKGSRRKSVDFTRDTKSGPDSPATDVRRGSYNMPTNIWKTRW